MKKLVILGLLALSATLAPAALADTAIVNVFSGCDGGVRIVPAGSAVELRLGWIAKTRGLVTEYDQAETTVLTIDGVPRLDADDPAWRSMLPLADRSGWLTRWIYPTGITLAAGESLSFVFDSTLSHRTHDGIVTEEGGFTRVGPGSIFAAPIACTVIGA